MSQEITVESKFIIPDDMRREDVEVVLKQLYDDLRRTDRFIDARVLVEKEIESDEAERLLDMLASIDEDLLESTQETIDSLSDES